MAFTVDKDGHVTHELSSVYGMLVVEFDGQAQFCTNSFDDLFENLEGIPYANCGKVRIVLVSSEDWSRDDVTDFVWGEMVEHYAGDCAHEALDDWDEHVGHKIGFCRWGYGEFDPLQESLRRMSDAEKRARFISVPRPAYVDPVYDEPMCSIAAE
ncbi:hypothetical protein [Pelagibacterium sediminicola]|uniref:hypothetical protein n=1 Tax=Pelagibacterium sediminicola TaxID=2248761 RepID=UPI0013004FC7|nr:hypothetical protein [Pelagibacterium sediminicola]